MNYTILIADDEPEIPHFDTNMIADWYLPV